MLIPEYANKENTPIISAPKKPLKKPISKFFISTLPPHVLDDLPAMSFLARSKADSLHHDKPLCPWIPESFFHQASTCSLIRSSYLLIIMGFPVFKSIGWNSKLELCGLDSFLRLLSLFCPFFFEKLFQDVISENNCQNNNPDDHNI